MATVTLMDGGMGSTLEDRGIPVRNALWGSYALLTPEGIAANDRLHADFVAAGARILIANTHNASLAACRTFLEGPHRNAVDLPPAVSDADSLLVHVNREALRSARRAAPAGSGIRVAVGIGSAEGAYAAESGLTAGQVFEALSPQLGVLRAWGADPILFETLTTRSEIEGVAELCRETGLAGCGVGLTCGADGRTLAGVTMEDAVAAFEGTEPWCFFVQCTRYDLVAAALAPLIEAAPAGVAVGVYANDGRIWQDMRWHGERVTPEAYAAAARTWAAAGATVIGGCCGTGPEHIAALAAPECLR